MSLQERVLAVLQQHGSYPAKDMVGLFPDVDRNALDCCLNALRRNNSVVLGGGNYSLVGERVAPIRVTAPVVSPPPKTETPPQRRCRECREAKALEDYPEIGPQKRRGKTCTACRERMAAEKKQQPTVSDGVLERVQARRQEALNRIAVLKVDVANLEVVVGECEQFLSLYQRFAEGSDT